MVLFIGLLLEWRWIIRCFTLAPGTHSTLQPQLAANAGPICYNCVVSISDSHAAGVEDSELRSLADVRSYRISCSRRSVDTFLHVNFVARSIQTAECGGLRRRRRASAPTLELYPRDHAPRAGLGQDFFSCLESERVRLSTGREGVTPAVGGAKSRKGVPAPDATGWKALRVKVLRLAAR